MPTHVSRWPRWIGRQQSLASSVARIGQQASELRAFSDQRLAQCAAELKRLPAGSRPIEASFALFYEALRRTLGIELYEVQLEAGLVMARGAIAQMQTGEGKTFAAALPAFHFALSGEGVHVATTNAYLAQRDSQLLSPALQLLGCTTGVICDGASYQQRRAAPARSPTFHQRTSTSLRYREQRETGQHR